MLEKERGLRRRRGAGQDASGAYRDIARDVFPPPEMLAGTRTTHENPWRYVLGCLLVRSSNSVDPSPSIKMLDTVLMEGTGGGHPEAFFFTAGNGTIKRKAGRFLGLKTIEKDLVSSASASHKKARHSLTEGGMNENEVVAMARTRDGEYLPLTLKALRTAVKAGAMPAGFDSLQAFKRAKDFDTTAEFANYEHSYILDDTGGGIPTGVVHRRVAMELSGRDGVRIGQRRNLVLSRNPRINAEIGATVRSVVLAVERSKHCRVLRLDAEFVLDEQNELWLAGVSSCRVAGRPVVSSRQAPSSGCGDAATTERGPDVIGAQCGALIGRERLFATEKRSRKREVEEAGGVLSDADFSQLLQRVGYKTGIKRAGRSRHRRRGREPAPRRRQEASHGALADSTAQSLEWVPSEMERGLEPATSAPGKGAADIAVQTPPSPALMASADDLELPITKLDQAATNCIHGSSQLEGCRGDFCEFDVCKRVREEETQANFIENAAKAAGASKGLVQNLSPLRLKILSMDDYDFGDASPPLAGEVRPAGRGPRAARHSDISNERYQIPYKAVVQARQERVLVEAFLRQYARGEAGEYLRGGGSRSNQQNVGGKYPGVYYRPVRVCSNCYLVYTLIDEARTQALQRDRSSNGLGRRHHHTTPKDKPGQPRAADRHRELSWTVGEGLESGSDTRKALEEPRSTDPQVVTVNKGVRSVGSEDGYEHSLLAVSMASAERAMDAISQGDVFELRSFDRPPAAIANVVSVVMILLEGERRHKTIEASWEYARAVMGRSDFFSRLQSFDPMEVTPGQLRAVQPGLEGPGLDPGVVRSFNNAAGNLCLWALGVMQAHSWITGGGHPRANIVPTRDNVRAWGHGGHRQSRGTARLPTPRFPQQQLAEGQTTPIRQGQGSPSPVAVGAKRGRVATRSVSIPTIDGRKTGSMSLDRAAEITHGTLGKERKKKESKTWRVLGPATSPTLGSGADVGFEVSYEKVDAVAVEATATGRSGGNAPKGPRRRCGGRVAAQAFASGRLANVDQPSVGGLAAGSEFVCSDGETNFPYRVCGDPAASTGGATSCNFVVVHDFFDNVDKTEVMFRPITRRHVGCRVLAFCYPGQAGTVFRVPLSMAKYATVPGSDGSSREAVKETSGPPPAGIGAEGEARQNVPNNAFLAPRLHELLQHVHSVGAMRLTAPFHLVGIGNGMAIAAAFALRYGDHPLYRSSLRSIVSINGFSSVDSQLAAVLHSSLNAFATLPPSRPDLPVSFVSRFMFSEDYIRKVGRTLALGIYTAVSNPISLEGRHMLCNSALLHKDISQEVGTIGVPIVMLQSTEDDFVNPANVDPFLRGRSPILHFWSHKFNHGGGGSSGEDVVNTTGGGSVYGRKGLTDLLRALSKPRGTFVAWVRAGHEVRQEAKRAVIDLLDALAKPTPEYAELDEVEVLGTSGGTFGLYPSPDFIARVNKRGTSQPVENVSPEGDRTNHTVNQLGASLLIESPQQGRTHQGRGEMDKSATLTTATSITSPFPRDLAIPRLPARVVQPAPNTSPLKKCKADFPDGGTNDPIKNAHSTAGRRPHSQDNEASEGFAFGSDQCVDRHGDRHPGRRGPSTQRRSRQLLDARGGGDRRPKVVWKDQVVNRASRQGMTGVLSADSGKATCFSGQGDGDRRNDYSTSHFPAAALLYGPDSPVKSKASHAPGSRGDEYSPTFNISTGQPGLNSDQWDLADASSSIELPMSDPLQRGRRRWTGNNSSGGGDGASSPSSSAGATAGTDPTPTGVKPIGDLLEAQASLEGRLCEARRREAERLKADDAATGRRFAGITQEQESRSKIFVEQDRAMVADLEAKLSAARLSRASADLQRAVDGVEIDDLIVREGLVSSADSLRVGTDSSGTADAPDAGAAPSRPMPPIDYSPISELPKELTRAGDAYSVMDDAARDEAKLLQMRKAAGGGGRVDLEQFQRDQAAAASDAATHRLAAQRTYKKLSQTDLDRAKTTAALRLQPLLRGVWGRKIASGLRREKAAGKKRHAAVIVLQTAARGRLARKYVASVRSAAMAEIVLGSSALRIQRMGRGMLGRRRAVARRKYMATLTLQRCYRGYLGRRSAARQRTVLEKARARHRAAVRIQNWWKCKYAVKKYAGARAFSLAAVEIQRCYRGVIGRRKFARTLEWEQAEPGPARLKLGMRLIEDTKIAFESQRLEIAALHTAEERAAQRTSRIRLELGCSEQELSALEREMNEIDQIEDELAQLTHERHLVQLGLMDVGQTMLHTDAPPPPVSQNGRNGVDGAAAGGVVGKGGVGGLSNVTDSVASYALEMQIQIKRAEREKKRQELEADFKGVREEVNLKRRELERVGNAIQEIESTRDRKTSEFRRMQTNLMELLREQKAELDSVKEKGVQLEVATATSAAAATATAQRAKDHEQRSSVMYSQTEELMKFQFMSMSLSYFSSLNMLNTMKSINADTTTAAVTSSADAAAAAAAASAAASLPAIKAGKVMESVTDVIAPELISKNKILEEKLSLQEDLEAAKAHPFPHEVRLWNTADVGYFLTTLGLRQYREAFEEAAVDGEFLLALDATDCADVLGVEHSLHSKKLFLAIDKLRPITLEDQRKKAAVEREDAADVGRGDMGRGDTPPDVETVFSQVRNGRVKRLAESLNAGFPVDTEDQHGNTALMIACQNCNTQMCEMLIQREANINHKNVRGNTPLHFAMAYDKQGTLGEMLISSGGDDTAANKDGLTCYDGLGVL